MAENRAIVHRRSDFCIECRKETEYLLQKKDIEKNIRDKDYIFGITVAVCAECGEEMSILGLTDGNVQEIDEQYRAAEGIDSIDAIEKLMKIYKIGKALLYLALGFGEITIPRYLEGQVPSKEYSDVVRAGLASPAYIKQKLLYFIHGIYSVLYGRPIFTEDCRAWTHGSVYPEIYDLFRDFKYNPIDDARFALLEGTADVLTDDEKKVIDLVVNTFGIYGGKVLERIAHNEDPWKEARIGYGDGIPFSELLPRSIRTAYRSITN